MPFPGTWGTALTTILTGQGNANADRAAYNAQIQQRQLEEQLKRAQLMMQMQDATDQRAALGRLPQEEQDYLRMPGGSIENYQKRGERTTKANEAADQLYQKSLDSNLPIEERLSASNLSAQLRAHPELIDSLPSNLKLAGIGEKTGKGFLLVDKDSGAPVDWTPGTKPPPNAIPISEYNALKNPSRSATELKPVYDPNRGVTSWTYVPKGGTPGSTIGEVRPTLGSSPQAEISTAATGMDRLVGLTKQLTSRGSGWIGAKKAVLERAAGMDTDPVVGDFLGQVSTVDSSLTGMVTRAWGSRNVSMAQQIIKYHVPHVGDSPALVAQKIQEWQQPGGYLDQYKTMVGMTPGTTSGGNPAAPAAKSYAPGTPIYDHGKVIGRVAPDGVNMVPVP